MKWVISENMTFNRLYLKPGFTLKIFPEPSTQN